jgi:hypothetical protein
MSRNLSGPYPQRTDASSVTSHSHVWVTVGIVSAVLTGLLTLSQDVLEARTPGIDMGFGWSALHTCWMATMCAALVGLTIFQWSRLDRFGRFASRFAMVGTGLMTLMAAYETITWYGRTDAPQGEPPPAVLAVILVVFAAYVAGLLLFSVATFRARVLPRAAAGLLFAAVVVQMAIGEVFGPLALLGAAVAALGLSAAFVRRRDERSTP